MIDPPPMVLPPPERAGAHTFRRRERRRNAFTLVELAMTALLLSIGILTVFALLRRGIASRLEMEDEVRAASFAETAFNTLRAVSDAAASSTNEHEWVTFWQNLASGATNLPLTVSREGGETDPLELHTSSLYGTSRPYRFSHANTQARIAYHCSVDLFLTIEGLRNYPTNRAQVTLHVWPSGNTNGPAQTFFTLFSNPGRLP